jgi:hypothetical protein
MSDMQQFIAAYSMTGAANSRTVLGPPDPSTRPPNQKVLEKGKKKKSALFHPFNSKKKTGKDLPQKPPPFLGGGGRGRDDDSDVSSMMISRDPFHDRQHSFELALGKHHSEWSTESGGSEGLDTNSQDVLMAHLQTRSLMTMDEVESLPPGWTCAITKEGAIYFINELEHITTWTDPRTVKPQSKPQPPAIVDHTSLPLPEGWEMAFTPEQVPYFIDHKRKITSWTDPRSVAYSASTANSAVDQEKGRLRLKQMKLAAEELELQLTLIRKQQEQLENELDQRFLDGTSSHAQLQAQADAKAMFAHEEMNLSNQYSLLQSQFAQLQGKMQGVRSSHRHTASDPLGTWGGSPQANTASSSSTSTHNYEPSKLRHLADLRLDTPLESEALDFSLQPELPNTLPDLSDLSPPKDGLGSFPRGFSDILNGDIPPEFDEYLGSWC